MEDYWKVPRELIYCERKNLNDFGVKVTDSLNGRLFKLLYEHFLSTDDAKALILRCFNNAYYLCTIILLEEFPNLCVDKYEKNLLDMNVQWNEDSCAASFALAYEMLQVYDSKWQKDCPLLQAMYKRFHSGFWHSVYAANSFNELIDKVDKSGTWLSKKEFEPRDIVEVVETFNVRSLMDYAEYTCERISYLEDPHQQKYWSDMAIARIKDYQRNLCEVNEYNPKKDSFKYDGNDHYMRDLAWEKNIRDIYKLSKYAIDYYIKHYKTKNENDSKDKTTETTKMPEIEVLQKTIREQESKLIDKEKLLKEADKIKSQQASRIKELEKQVKELTQELAESDGKQEWIDWLDWEVFHPSIKAEEVYKTLNENPTPQLGDKARCYVLFRVLAVIKWLKKDAAQKDVLKWWGAHFGCNWNNDNQLKFTDIPDRIKKATSIEQWKSCGGNNNELYYNFAQELIKAFVWNKGRDQYISKKLFIKEGCFTPEQ